jgi:serine/threonine-protein kinase HipA
VAEELALWLYGIPAALVSAPRGRLRLQYTDEAYALYEIGAPVLSVGLPLTPEAYTAGPTRAFLDGLLPEGSVRAAVAQRLAIDEQDTFALAEALGRDCAGAIVILPKSAPPPAEPSSLRATPLTDDEVVRRITELPQKPLGIDGGLRLSLAGVQDKLVLVKLPSGEWAEPTDGTPTTHLLKPQGDRFARLVENEAFCMKFGLHLGVSVANVAIETIGSVRLLAVERFDRQPGEGVISRVHQEDMCQALSRPVTQKYEDRGGPSLRDIAAVLQGTARASDLEAFLRALVINLLIGNCDAHGKNFSLTHTRSGEIRLAPLYDLVSTLFYPELERHLAMSVDKVQRIERIRVSRIVNEAASWGMSRARAAGVVEDMLARTPDAIEAARTDVPGVPDALPQLVRSQLELIAGD